MQSLRRWKANNRTEVKMLQAWLNQFASECLSVDGTYGKKTEAAVKRYQLKQHLEPDGKAGPQTLNHMGFRTTKDKGIIVLEIPFGRISQANVLWEERKGRTPKEFAGLGYDIVWNTAFYELKTGNIVHLLIQAGKVQHWGMGNMGLAFPNQWRKAFKAYYSDVIGKPFDLQGAAPVLVNNGIRDDYNLKTFNQSIARSKVRRNCMGIRKDCLILMFTIQNRTLQQMANEGVYQQVEYLQGNDGGGSVFYWMGGAPVITTDGRKPPAALGLKVLLTVT